VRSVVSRLENETVTAARAAARSLAGLWLHRSSPDAAADSLRALSEESMRDGIPLLGIEAVDRLVVARSLRQRGMAREAERYMMWLDAGVNLPQSMSVRTLLYPLATYERAVALDEAGDDDAAAYQFRRVLTSFDLAPETHRSVIEDTKRRLAIIEQSDVPAQRPVGGAKKN
jgi:hypothetical protein